MKILLWSVGLVTLGLCAGCNLMRQGGKEVHVRKPSGANAEGFEPTQVAPMPSTFGKIESPSGDGICKGSTVADPPTRDAVEALRKTSGLSDAYLNGCADCHGSIGEGRPEFPALGSGTVEAFIAVVRSGQKAMPAFGAALVTDEQLRADFAVLAARPPQSEGPQPGTSVAPLAPIAAISDAAFAETMAKGLPVWRDSGKDGACSSCHGPDGIDLARIGYSRATIVRRSVAQGRSAEGGMLVADMIDALRARYEITTPCSPTRFRPFQPGGQPLGGSTPVERDANFEKELARGGIDLTQPPRDLAAAKGLLKAFAELDVRSIRLGLELNPWTADGFHGAAERTSAEWIPELPMEPRDHADEKRWIKLQNQYLATPDDKSLWAMYDFLDHLSARRVSPGGVAERLSREKLKSVLVVQHMMRHDRAAFPDVKAAPDLHRFSIWEVGQVAVTMLRGCGVEASVAQEVLGCWGYTPKFFEKMAPEPDALLADAQRMVLPWLTAGLVIDPGLQFTEGGDAQMLHWHDAAKEAAVELPMHELYFGALRLTRAYEAGDSRFGTGRGFGVPVANGCWSMVRPALDQWLTSTLPAIEARGKDAPARTAALAVNRAALFAIQESLKVPIPVCPTPVADVRTRLQESVKTLGSWGKSGLNSGPNDDLAQQIVGSLP